MNKLMIHVLLAVLAAAWLVACASREQGTVYRGASPEPPADAVVEDVEPQPADQPPPDIERTMLIADILYEARDAFDDNRLLLPSHDNAFDRYLQVLGLDPGNAVAHQGIRDIVARYVQLADQSMRLGQYDEAERLLDRAASIGRDRERVTEARARLEQARQNRVEFLALDREELNRQSPEVVRRLGEISQRLGEVEDATFLIVARSDAEGRWIYRVMREAAGGRRLRGNIEVGERPGVLIRYPSS